MNAPRCNRHKEAVEAPRLCHACQRIAVEQEIATRTVDALLAAGYLLQTDIQEEPRPDRGIILCELMEVDDEYLGACRDGRRVGWVRFVYGNSGYDVISDYTTNLESVLAPVNAYADTMAV